MKLKCLFLTIAVLLIVGCKKEISEPVPELYCQVIVKSAMINDDINYSVLKVLRSNEEMKEVYNTNPEGTFNISDEIIDNSVFYEIHSVTEYTENEPPEGTYIFNILFGNGMEKMAFATISKPYLVPVDNISISMDKGIITLKWNNAVNADYYEISAGRNGGKKVFIGKTENCDLTIDPYEFSEGESFDIDIEISAKDVKDNPQIISSESLARINYHIDEFLPWWYYWD